MSEAMTDSLLHELNRAKVLFQARTLATIIGAQPPERLDEMNERQPITDPALLDHLDDKELFEGYCDGKDGLSEPGNNRSLSYWHGWRNGRADAGHDPIDAAQRALAKAYTLSRIQQAD